MSDQEKTGGNTPVIVVEQTEGSVVYHHTHLRDPATEDAHHKVITNPVVPTAKDDHKEISNATTAIVKPNQSDDIEPDISSASKTPKKHNEKSGSPIEIIPIDTFKVDTRPSSPESSSPISAIPSTSFTTVRAKEENDQNTEQLKKSLDEYSITEDNAGVSTPESKRSEWSHCSHCKGLRSESHSSMVTRAVRKLFCCGVSYNAPSEDDVSFRESHAV